MNTQVWRTTLGSGQTLTLVADRYEKKGTSIAVYATAAGALLAAGQRYIALTQTETPQRLG